MRQTRQRAAILSVLRQTDHHPTADWIHQEVRKTMPHVSLGTVYRALDALCQEGIVTALEYGARQRRYDGNPGPHSHIVCTGCGRIADVITPMPQTWQQQITQTTGFEVYGHRLEWYGLCVDCARAIRLE